MGISNDFGSLVVGMGTGFEKESTRAPQHDELEELIRDIICYAPWDEDNLYDRLMDRAVYREGYDQCTMRNYASYLSKLMQTAYGLPRDNSVSRLRSNRSVQYEIPKHTHSCPSLTDGSTLSEPSQAPRRVPAPIRMRPAMGAMKATVNHQATLPNTNAQYPLDDKNAQNGAVDYTSGGDEDSMGIDDAQGLEGNSSAQPHEENDFSPPNTGTPMSTSSEDEDEYEEEEGEEEDDGDDESEEDPIESLHDAIRQVFLLNTGVAERVIDHLNNLPPDRRAEVYGYEAVSSHSPGRPRSGGNSTSFSDKPKARKRKRIGTSPSGSAQDHVHESDDEENHVRVSRRSSKNQPGIRKFACGFHLLDASKYCTGSTLGITPTQYRTCAGPGFETINHYKRHLGRKHVLHQCSRCGSIFKKPGDLQVHLAQDQRCDVTPFEPRNDMSQNKWEDVQEAFENPNGVYDDKERWFRVWDKLFPGVPRPPEP
ncbi:uncharacterized protein F4822DRAFT_188712 [Hypoxylon trugodes]|uniref:uncharacterized protein n=1 Tax=Hypoxylon trugodes TaxID=326681 RepID=UPI00219B282D|nr:uncharacterized protein F4822DRAFT_188712 [Hypoxylon trugodes]KAI1391539.1 hypothetical protein F4822DRAFT_188712 [Hypoxylon trugodes]